MIEVRNTNVVEQPKEYRASNINEAPVKSQGSRYQSEARGSSDADAKKGCPSWLWILLGILALLAITALILWGLGVFSGKTSNH